MTKGLLNLKDGRTSIHDSYVILSDSCLMNVEDWDLFNSMNINVEGVILRTRRPKCWDIKGWFKLIREICKYIPVEE